MDLIGNIVQEVRVYVFELPLVLVKLLWYYIEGIYYFLVPAGFRAKEVHGETVLITGGGSGLGRLMAIKLARRGCCVVIVDVNQTGNAETAQLIREEGGLVHSYTCDLCNRQKIYEMAEKVKRDVGDVDILINNAGVVSGNKFMETPDEKIELTMNVNINAHFWTVKAFLPAMIKHNHGHIVTIASMAGLCGTNGLTDYHASKFAAVGFDESLRDELLIMGKDGINTTCVCPIYINTGMFKGVITKLPLTVPLLDQNYVTDKIIEAILTNQQVLLVPRVLYILMALKWLLPTKGLNLLLRFTGGSAAMDTFVGRKND